MLLLSSAFTTLDQLRGSGVLCTNTVESEQNQGGYLEGERHKNFPVRVTGEGEGEGRDTRFAPALSGGKGSVAASR